MWLLGRVPVRRKVQILGLCLLSVAVFLGLALVTRAARYTTPDLLSTGAVRNQGGVIGAIVGIVPLLSGIAVLFDPLRRKAAQGEPVFVAPLGAIPEDGTPRKFTIVASRTDAWNRSPQTPIGAVYLRRTGPKTVTAFNVVCPHAGCFVEFMAARNGYFCPCHDSTFALDGRISTPRSPSPRPLDALDVEIRNDHEVWVIFQNFRAGIHEKVPA